MKISVPTWVQIFILAVTSLIGGVTIGFYTRSDRIETLESQIETLNFSQKAKLPENVAGRTTLNS